MNNEIDKTMLIDTKGMPLQKIFDILHNNNIHNKEIHCKEMFIDLIDDDFFPFINSKNKFDTDAFFYKVRTMIKKKNIKIDILKERQK